MFSIIIYTFAEWYIEHICVTFCHSLCDLAGLYKRYLNRGKCDLPCYTIYMYTEKIKQRIIYLTTSRWLPLIALIYDVTVQIHHIRL